MKILKNMAILGLSAFMLLQLGGCAQMVMSPVKPDIENTQKARNAGIIPLAVGEFVIDAAHPALDKGVSIRSNGLTSPLNGSFAQYLRATLEADLQSAGLLDPASGALMTATLLQSQLEAPIGQGRALLEARFVVKQGGAVRFDKALKAEASWDSPFVGASAIPLAAGQYEALYHKLSGLLLDDVEFRKALAK